MTLLPCRLAAIFAPSPGAVARPWAGRALLAGWLVYSAVALGWFLSQDPFLSTYVCGAR